MYFRQADIFWGLEKHFVKEIMKNAVQESHEEGKLLFGEGDVADTFYVLLKGRIKLNIGKTGRVVYVVSKAGEAFGWSSLIDRDVYTASAECQVPTKLLKFDKAELQKVLDEDPVNGLIFFKRLAGTLGTRLLQSYSMITSASMVDATPLYGTGQVQETEAPELET